ncbi:MAG: J domain-containing protein [Candidatus Limnocylindrales bacterium]
MNIPDPYKVLQVDPEAEDEVIEAAYRRLARKYHPDVAAGPDAQDRMVRINQAWEMLREPTKRAAVDRARIRNADTTARVASADARARTAAHGPASSGRSARDYGPQGQARPQPGAPGTPPRWGFPGVQDPGDSELGARPQFVSPNWTTGRSHSGAGYDPRTMGTAQGDGSAGPPPGNAFGSLLNFGRYAGWSLGEIARADLGYLEWLDRTPIGRTYQAEIDELLRTHKRRVTAGATAPSPRGLFRRR